MEIGRTRECREGYNALDCLIRQVYYCPYEIGGYPFDEADVAHREWQIPVDEWLKSIGEYICSVVPYRLALIGFEVSGEVYASEIAEKGVPAERYIGYLWAEGGSLEWHPPNMWLAATEKENAKD